MKKIQILGGSNEENKILEEGGAIKKTFNDDNFDNLDNFDDNFDKYGELNSEITEDYINNNNNNHFDNLDNFDINNTPIDDTPIDDTPIDDTPIDDTLKDDLDLQDFLYGIPNGSRTLGEDIKRLIGSMKPCII